ncbi:MAG TPA: hypothetical protein VG820_03640 [Fimbriimonadaceae bacterium]|nr:hypothetical protein [Fimbriimonadaceae bacterium]
MINGTLMGTNQTQFTHVSLDTQMAQNFKALSSALQSGDLAGARKAFGALQANAPKNASAQNDPAAKDFDALGQALQSGDLGAAQKAFATIQQDMQAKWGHHGGHMHKPTASADADGDNDGSTSGVAGATLNISA